MIPRAVDQVFKVAEDLKSKGWLYKIEGEFIEIVSFLSLVAFCRTYDAAQYNETINDLLGKHEFDKKKHEIRHEKSLVTGTPVMRVTDINVVTLISPSQVRSLLAIAQSHRSVASTLMNERSSRSHSVFTLRVSGTNSVTGEKCDGSLNLVDLAGSERLKEVGHGLMGGTSTEADKDRLKETQNINRSLSALGDVIAALGESGRPGAANGEKHHIPYRNSKVGQILMFILMLADVVTAHVLIATFAERKLKNLGVFNALPAIPIAEPLQMILNLSPMAAHLNESLTSLRFATKVIRDYSDSKLRTDRPAGEQHNRWYSKEAD
jgi:kinesin family protein C1